MKIWLRMSSGRRLGIVFLIGLGTFCLQWQSHVYQGAGFKDTGYQGADTIAAQAQAALRAGNYAVAIERLKELVKTAPNVAEVHSNLGIAYYFSGRFVDAVREFRLALKLKPALTNAHDFLGASLAESGYCKEALPYLERDFPQATDRQLKRILGADTLRCYLELNEADNGIKLDQVLRREYPDDPEILYLSIHLYSNLSASASQHLLAIAPRSYQFHRMNAEVLEFQGKPGDAMAEFRKALEINPHVAGIHYAMGKLLLQQGPGSLTKAKEEFQEELKIDPGNADAEYQLGEIAGSLRDWNGALAHLQRATDLKPKFVAAQIALGEAYVSAGRVKEAAEPLERAVEAAPENPIAHYRLAFVYRRLGRTRDAEQQLAAYKKAENHILQSKEKIRGSVAEGLTKSEAGTADH